MSELAGNMCQPTISDTGIKLTIDNFDGALLVRENNSVTKERNDLLDYQAHSIGSDYITECGETLSGTLTKNCKLALESA